MQSVLLALVIFFQAPVPPAPVVPPAIKLTVPDHPVGFARSVRIKIDQPVQGPAPNDWASYSVEWDVTELAKTDNPLENDLDIDSNTLKATIPSGLAPTTLKVKVVVTFVYKDSSTRVARDTKYVTIVGVAPTPPQPQPGPTPGPGPVNPPVPGPAPSPPLPTQEVFGLTTWTKAQLWKSTLPPAQAKALSEGFHLIATTARGGAYSTKDDVVLALKARNISTLGSNIQPWIDGFLKPLQAELNPMNPKIKTVADQATVFDEIGNGLDAYSSGVH
jgi:hypothetical protein